MSNPLFQINDLRCAYQGTIDKTVLHIPNLTIGQGKLIFLLGASGSGKSTILEALGLMNNTIASGSLIFTPPDDSPIDYTTLWQADRQSEIAALRRQYFSFIFQQTNLMENFTTYENVSLSKMIQSEVSQGQATSTAVELMEKVGLSEAEVTQETLAVNLSGGQRQRVAFVRALNTEFTVLFGDEPTGNLDERNAHELLNILKESLQPHQSAILVSHDIDLALKFADQIFVIDKEAEGYGTIQPTHIFERSGWENDPDRLRGLLGSFYHTPLDEVKSDIDSRTNPIESAKKADIDKINYRNLFFTKEGKALMGKNFQNLLILVVMLCFTFLAIGFANGSLNYLEEKMQDPFVKWMDIEIPWAKQDVSELKRSLNDDSLKERYAYGNVSAYSNDFIAIEDQERGGAYRVRGRSFYVDDTESTELLDAILDESNIIFGDTTGFEYNEDLSLIVTANLLEKFHYPTNSQFIYLAFSTDTLLEVPIPIKAVVRNIPGKNSFVFTTCFYKTYGDGSGVNPFDIRQYKYDIRLFINGGEAAALAVKSQLQQLFDTNAGWNIYRPLIDIYPYDLTHLQGYEIVISLDLTGQVDFTFYTVDSLYNQLISSDLLQQANESSITRIYNYESVRDCNIEENADHLSIYFNSLDRVRAFAEYLREEYNTPEDQQMIEVDTTKVKEKENFNFLSKVAWIVGILLLLFSIISISLFISNLLKMHFSKVAMNIGTFKAFGLKNEVALNVYFLIVVRFLGIGMLIGGGLAWFLGKGIDVLLKQSFNAEDTVSYFLLVNGFTLLTVFFILLITLMVSWWTIRRMLSKSPGDLIYNR